MRTLVNWLCVETEGQRRGRHIEITQRRAVRSVASFTALEWSELATHIQPLSIPSLPIFFPISPIATPGRSWYVFGSRRGTMKVFVP